MIRHSIALVFLLTTLGSGLFAQRATLPEISIIAFVARNSQDRNEFKNKADWIELQYTGQEAFELKKISLYVSDRSSEIKLKFELPPRTLKPGEVWRVWCDSENVFSNQVHTNFKLSKRGEDIGLFYTLDGLTIHELDRWTYTRIPKDECGKRRLPEGKIVPLTSGKE